MSEIQIGPVSPSDFRRMTPRLVEGFASSLLETPPWFIEIYQPETRKRFVNESRRIGFGAVIALHDDQIVGMSSYERMRFSRQAFDRAGFGNVDALYKFLLSISLQHGISNFVGIYRTFVTPPFRRQHIATEMRARALAEIQAAYPGGVIVFTQHHEDNPGIIESSKRLGFKPTGIRHQEDENGENQYWYKVLPPTA